jgi:hypothetical protein
MTVCTLVLVTTTALLQISKLTPDDARTKFWEYSHTANYPDIAIEAIYCDKKLVMIENAANLDAIPGHHPASEDNHD